MTPPRLARGFGCDRMGRSWHWRMGMKHGEFRMKWIPKLTWRQLPLSVLAEGNHKDLKATKSQVTQIATTKVRFIDPNLILKAVSVGICHPKTNKAANLEWEKVISGVTNAMTYGKFGETPAPKSCHPSHTIWGQKEGIWFMQKTSVCL